MLLTNLECSWIWYETPLVQLVQLTPEKLRHIDIYIIRIFIEHEEGCEERKLMDSSVFTKVGYFHSRIYNLAVVKYLIESV